MTENNLKTLKDMERGETCHGDKCTHDIEMVANIDELKAEAVKWIKSKGNCGLNINEAMDGDIISWIKHFFNINESDLE